MMMDDQTLTTTKKLPSPISVVCSGISLSQSFNNDFNNIVIIPKKKLRLLLNNLEKINVLFSVKLIELNQNDNLSDYFSYHVVTTTDTNDLVDIIEVTKRVQVKYMNNYYCIKLNINLLSLKMI